MKIAKHFHDGLSLDPNHLTEWIIGTPQLMV
jgi:hypothetical protein